jgi:hypothetical protein
MSGEPLFRRSKSHVGDSIGDDTIVVNILNGTYYSLTSDASQVWQTVNETPSPLPTELHGPAFVLSQEGIIDVVEGSLAGQSGLKAEDFFTKYSDMADILMADPIHDVDDDGWPILR